jgi:hypothetical protein
MPRRGTDSIHVILLSAPEILLRLVLLRLFLLLLCEGGAPLRFLVAGTVKTTRRIGALAATDTHPASDQANQLNIFHRFFLNIIGRGLKLRYPFYSMSLASESIRDLATP